MSSSGRAVSRECNATVRACATTSPRTVSANWCRFHKAGKPCSISCAAGCKDAAGKFRRWRAMIISQTPLRISFLGGGTDYPEHFLRHGGAVLGTAVDKFAFLTLSRFYSSLFDHSIRISYRQVERVGSLDEIQHAPVRECLRWAGIKRDVEVHHAAELPAFTGLGSSSSFVVGLLNAIHAFQGRSVEPLELAYQAIEIERDVLDESVGCQDQTFAAVGGFNLIEFRGREDFLVHPLPWKIGRAHV